LRSKFALYNMWFSLILVLTTLGASLILPRLLIREFGSSVYGLTTSISQFLGYLVLLQAGIGGVVRAALYKPLAANDIEKVSIVLKTSASFFRKLAFISILYIFILVWTLPFIIKGNPGFIFTATLVMIIGVGLFIRYYFGITYQMLLSADQKNYFSTILQIILIIINIMLVVVLIKLGAGIHLVMIGSTSIFIIRPIVVNFYVRKKYKIKTDCQPDKNLMVQRWDGIGHTVAYFIHSKTDIFLLTIFLGIKEVAVYSVYAMITSGLNSIITTIADAVTAAFGNMIAKDENNLIDKNFKSYECLIHSITIITFASAAVLVTPFIKIYTRGFNDANYLRDVFPFILLAAECVYCLRQPYHMIITTAGHYKQTRNGAFVEAALNIVLSITLIQFFGTIGVVTGTLVAMLYRTLDYFFYLRNNILFIKIRTTLKRLIISVMNMACIIIFMHYFVKISIHGYLSWIGSAILTTVIAAIMTYGINLLFYRKEMKDIYLIARRLVKKKTQ
jgi:O-antigen/teichoic acid export membrane protein